MGVVETIEQAERIAKNVKIGRCPRDFGYGFWYCVVDNGDYNGLSMGNQDDKTYT